MLQRSPHNYRCISAKEKGCILKVFTFSIFKFERMGLGFGGTSDSFVSNGSLEALDTLSNCFYSNLVPSRP